MLSEIISEVCPELTILLTPVRSTKPILWVEIPTRSVLKVFLNTLIS
jgi:hypothetical protein